MEWIKPGTRIDFMRMKNIFITISAIVVLAGIISLIARGGPRYGVEFTGGVLVQVQFTKNIALEEVRTMLKEIGLGESLIQKLGDKSEYIVKTEKSHFDLNEINKQIDTVISKHHGKDEFEIRRVEMVGPQVAKDLQSKALTAILLAIGGIIIYVAWRFQPRFALGSLLASVHDPLIILGIYSIFNWEVTLPVVAAILTIMGYSLNDTIVVFDRIRDNLKIKKREKLEDIINISINDTLSRTLITALSVLFVSMAFYFFGGEIIHDFALIFLLGVLIGTYSSIFIASPVIIWWPEKKRAGSQTVPVASRKSSK